MVIQENANTWISKFCLLFKISRQPISIISQFRCLRIVAVLGKSVLVDIGKITNHPDTLPTVYQRQ